MDVGHDIKAARASWNFGGNVAGSFVDHVRQSVPFYDDGHDLVCHLSDFFCQDDGVCYELGVSTGQLIRKLAEYQSQKPRIRWIGIDREAEMIAKAEEHCRGVPNVQLVCDDILLHDYQPCELIVAYYTLQFVPARHRQDMFNRVFQSLNWGGAFVLFEKVRAPDARFQDIMTTLYEDFKKRNGFTPDEIFNKKQSLKGVLDPFSTQGNLDLLKRAGFQDVMTVMKYVCFEGFLAIK
jgi:tRNA (cmo5U34)-methyltransferase